MSDSGRSHGEHVHARPLTHDDVHEHIHTPEDAHLHPHPHEASPEVWASKPPTAHLTPLLYIDCFSGIAGDMLLGALLDAGLALDVLQAQLATLDLDGYRLEVRSQQSYGITGTKLDVVVDEAVQPERRLRDIVALLDRSALPSWVRTTAEAVFRRLALAEAKIHGSTVDAVHFHEVGAVDSIVDIVGSLIGLHALGIQRVFASSLPLPGGTVRAAHGLLPAPAPATLEILAGVGAPTRPAPVLGELVTPTGAAILAELATFEQPSMRVWRVGYGYGTKSLPWPNAVRVWLGEAWTPAPPRVTGGIGSAATSTPRPPIPALARGRSEDTSLIAPDLSERMREKASDADPSDSSRDAGLPDGVRRDEIIVLEANIDDATPELLGYAMARIFEAGALDVAFTPMQMKKHRPGTLLTVLGRPDDTNALASAMLRETTTLGVRLRRSERIIAGRRTDMVLTPYGSVRVKSKVLDGRATPAPEHDDCAALARQHGIPLSDVYRAALIAAAQADQTAG